MLPPPLPPPPTGAKEGGGERGVRPSRQSTCLTLEDMEALSPIEQVEHRVDITASTTQLFYSMKRWHMFVITADDNGREGKNE